MTKEVQAPENGQRETERDVNQKPPMVRMLKRYGSEAGWSEL
jgi:hypothetical protein